MTADTRAEVERIAEALTKAQREAVVHRNANSCAYGWAALNTLRALNVRKLVDCLTGSGAFSFPRTAIQWPLTPPRPRRPGLFTGAGAVSRMTRDAIACLRERHRRDAELLDFYRRRETEWARAQREADEALCSLFPGRGAPPMTDPMERALADLSTLGEWLGFSASCIKSGEPWTATCETMRGEARAALGRLARVAASAAKQRAAGREEALTDSERLRMGWWNDMRQRGVAQDVAISRIEAALRGPAAIRGLGQDGRG